MTLKHLARTTATRIRRSSSALGMAIVRGAARGQSMVEYAIVLALIAVVAMVAVQALGVGVGQVFTNILTKITTLGR